MYGGSVAQIYPSTTGFNFIVSSTFTARSGDSIYYTDIFNTVPSVILFAFHVIIKELTTTNKVFSISMDSWDQTHCTFYGSGSANVVVVLFY